MTKCPLTRGVRLREMSVSGGSTVFINSRDPKFCFTSFSISCEFKYPEYKSDYLEGTATPQEYTNSNKPSGAFLYQCHLI